MIRDPRETIPSYLRLEPDARVESIGFESLHEIYTAVADRTGRQPVVVDASDLVRDPQAVTPLARERGREHGLRRSRLDAARYLNRHLPYYEALHARRLTPM